MDILSGILEVAVYAAIIGLAYAIVGRRRPPMARFVSRLQETRDEN